MKNFLFAILWLSISLHAEDQLNSYEENGKISSPITVKAYATFLKESPVENNLNQLYHPPMEEQLLQLNTPALTAEESDGHNYIVIEGEENEPIRELTDFDIRCYKQWLSKNNQGKETSTESLDERSSPLMMFGFEAKDPTPREQNNTRCNPNEDRPQTTTQRGNNGPGVLAESGHNNQENRMNTGAASRGLQLIDVTDDLANIHRELTALEQGNSLPAQNTTSERVGLLAGRSVQQVEPEAVSSCLPRLQQLVSFCFPCLRRTPAPGEERVAAMVSVSRTDRYGAVSRAEPNFSEKLKTVLTNQKFKAGRDAPAQELQSLINDCSIITRDAQNQLITDLVSDRTVSTKDLRQLVSYLKQQSASSQRTQKEDIIQAVIDRRKQEVEQELRELPLERLHELAQQISRQQPHASALFFVTGSRFGLSAAPAPSLTHEPGYSKIQDDALYSSLVKKAVADKTRTFKAVIATNNSAVIPRSMKPTQFLSFLDVEVDTRQVLGQGGFGRVYSAQNRVTQEPLVYKEELQPEGLTQGPLHRDIKTTADLLRQGDIAAAALLSLPHFVEAEALIVKAISNNTTSELHYVPAANLDQFIKSLVNVKDIQIIGQLMKKAPGKALRNVLNSPEWKNFSLSQRVVHFDAIVQQSFEYFSKAYTENFVHRDIKPENIIYDMATKKLTIIDAGLATKLDIAPTIVKRAGLLFAGKNPIGFKTTSEVQAGTPLYQAPAIKQGATHGPEVDAHAFAKVFLELIDPMFCFTLMHNPRLNNEEIKNVQSYRVGLENKQQSFSRSPLNNFLQDSSYDKRVALVDAFFELGSYVNKMTQTNWKSTRFNNLKKSYAEAYPTNAARK